MHARVRILVGATLATAAVAALSGNANATDAPTSQQLSMEAYESHLAAGEAAPVTPEEALTYSETKTFLAAAHRNNESDKDIDALLTSGTWVGYPVSETVEKPTDLTDAAIATDVSTVTTGGDTTGDVTPGVSNWTPPTFCSNLGRTVYMQNAFHKTLWYYQVKEHYCYEGGTITSYDKEPTINHKVYAWAEALGWEWTGADLSGTKGPSYYTWQGDSRGGLTAWRKGGFKYSPYKIPIGAMNRYPWVHLSGHADGTNANTAGIS
ncbi:hypothetical protein [Streptomyces sp. NPDC002671]